MPVRVVDVRLALPVRAGGDAALLPLRPLHRPRQLVARVPGPGPLPRHLLHEVLLDEPLSEVEELDGDALAGPDVDPPGALRRAGAEVRLDVGGGDEEAGVCPAQLDVVRGSADRVTHHCNEMLR